MAVARKAAKICAKKPVKTAAKKTVTVDKKTTVAKGKKINFTISAEGATAVMVAGDFNNWDDTKTPLKKNKTEWKKQVLLKPGRYEYKFIVDGHWLKDPNNANVAHNSFGSENSVLEV